MWYLITITCATLLACDYTEVSKKAYESLKACQEEMDRRYPELEDGQGVMCYKREDITT